MNKLPILFLENFFLFPACDNYLSLENNPSWKSIILQALINHRGQLLVVFNKEKNIDFSEKVNFVGALGKISLEVFEAGSFEQIVSSCKEIKLKGLERVKIASLEKKNEEWEGEYEVLIEKKIDEKVLEELTEKFIRHFSNILEKTKLGTVEKFPYMTMMRGNISNLIDFIAQNSQEIDSLIKWKIFSSLDLKERLELLINLPDRRKIESDIEKDTRDRINNQQEEYFLREKLKAIEKRLRNKKSSEGGEMNKYLDRLEKFPYPDYVKKVVQEEIERYDSMPSNSSEANIIKQYVDWLVNLPWWERKEEIRDLNFAQRKLDENHFGLSEIKGKVIEYLAAQQKADKPLSQVICLVGPPGVGKTSLASSIAEATGRKFVSISLGGARDVAEISGHRRTYIGAMPGKIVQAMKKVQVINPLFLIDEIDKISSYDHRGDPVYALLEVLDPSQNKKFVDNYLGEEVPYNLSEVMFLCTANTLDLPLPLLDRMEIIRLSSYTEMEKFRIAKEHLLPENLKKYNLNSEEIVFEDQAIRDIIKYYTREAGVRELNRKIQVIVRKFIVRLLQGLENKTVVTPDNLKDYLKKRIHEFTLKQKNPKVGVVNGLAWTGYGGDILPIEVNLVTGKGELGRSTGSLGKVMKESVEVAFSYVQSYLEEKKKTFKKALALLRKRDVNVHAPEGAVEKEGPSAGIALTTAILSALTNQKVPADIGMTGEITSKGKVLEIGGLKEKAIAACRSELKTIVIPKSNEKDIEEIPEEIRQELKILPVEEYEEVWKIVFAKDEEKKQFSVPIKLKQIRAKRQEKGGPKQRI